jgi:pimeloyl-ACP methyl ester carboxylesterase
LNKRFIINVLKEFPGKMVTVNNHKIHIYTEGEGNPNLIFMSGSGTYSPMYDFKALYSKMTDEYKITVIEKAGYGFSEISNISRDIDTLLYETRTALKEVNINPPYILFPHSMSAIEALYWIQCYPDEIIAIIGLDTAFPPFYEKLNITPVLKKMKTLSKIINVNFKWLLPIIAKQLSPIKYRTLNKIETRICKALNYHRFLTNDMLNESEMVKENAKKLNIEKINKIPMLLFISNYSKWEESIREYTKNFNVEILLYNAGHYLHNIFPDDIADRSKIFIKKIIK